MKSTSIKLSLDTRRQKTDGTYPVILRLTHKGRTTSLKTGVSVKETDWDHDLSQIRNSYKGASNVKRLNNELLKLKAEALDKILQTDKESEKRSVTLSEVRQKISPEASTFSFYDYTSGLVKNLISAERIGTARSYQGVLSVLKTYNKGKPQVKNLGGNPRKSKNDKFSPKHNGTHYRDLRFEEISYSFLKGFENYHLAVGNQLNGLAVYLRTIRSIYNQAIKEGIIERSFYPFNEYKIKTKPTQKRALDSEHIKKIVSYKLKETHVCFDARNFFLASYSMYGMNFADMARLQKSDIVDGRIQYRRRKTGKLYDIRVTENLQEILSYYSTKNQGSEYIFPIIKRENPLFQEKDIQWARKLFNKNLKSLAGLCGISQNLTSYVSRHSFATHAMMNNIPVNAISSMLGHSSLKTTEIYLKSLPSNVLDEYNKKIVSF